MTAPTPDVEAMEWAAEYIEELIATADEEGEECYAQPLRDKAGLISALLAQAREAAGLREALELIAVGDVPRPVSTPWRDDGKPSKNDKCEHGVWMYEDCGDCISDFALRALTPAEKETPND